MGTGDSGPRVDDSLVASDSVKCRLEMMTVRERAPSLTSGAICMIVFWMTVDSSNVPLSLFTTLPILGRLLGDPSGSVPFSALLPLSCSKRLRTAAKLPALGFKSVSGCGCSSVISIVIARFDVDSIISAVNCLPFSTYCKVID